MFLRLILLLKISNCLKYLNQVFQTTMQPTSRYLSAKSSFGWSAVYSRVDKVFYVGAPLAPKDDNDMALGAVFKCDPKTLPCQKYIKIPHENLHNPVSVATRKPLFGNSVVQLRNNDLVICAPNYHVADNPKHCYKYSHPINPQTAPSESIPAHSHRSYNLITNFGIHLAYDKNNPLGTLIIGERKFYDAGDIQPASNAYPQLLEELPDGNVKRIRTFEDNTPSNTFLINPTNNAEIYLIISYHLAANLRGLFEVKSQDHIKRQDVAMITGSAGQFFGFSGVLAAFNTDQCPDVAFSAPFYSEIMDEGVVYIFLCNPSTNLYNERPDIVLHGDYRSFARFGISIVALGTLANDGIQFIAVLAPFWYTSDPVIFIYGSNGGTQLHKRFLQKIVCNRDSAESPYFLAYHLLSYSDAQTPNSHNVLVQFPSNNTIKTLTAIDSKKIRIDTSHEVLAELPSPALECLPHPSSTCYFASKYRLKSCVTIIPATENSQEARNRVAKDRVNIKHSFNKSPGAVLSGQIQKNENTYRAVISNEMCLTTDISFLYQSTSVAPIQVQIHGYIDHESYTLCGGYCSDSDPVSSTYSISNSFAECNSDQCGPNFVFSHEIIKKFQRGLVSNIHLRLQITNNGPTDSYIWRLAIKIPLWIEPKSIKIAGIADNFVSTKITTSTEQRTVIYEIHHVATVSNTMQTDIELEARSSLLQESATMSVLLKDPMYLRKNVDEVVLTVHNDDEYPLHITGMTMPARLSIDRDLNLDEERNKVIFEFTVDIQNMAFNQAMKDITLEIELVEVEKHTKFLSLIEKHFVNGFTGDCDVKIDPSCSQVRFVLAAPELPAQALRRFYAAYAVTNQVMELIKFNVDTIELKSKVCFALSDTSICKTASAKTQIHIPPRQNEITSVWPIVLATILSCLFVVALVVLIIKTKFLNRFRKVPETA